MSAQSGGRGGRRPRLALAAAALLAAVGCSTTPASPTGALSDQFGLLPGDYTLVVYVPKGVAGKDVICIDDNRVPDTASIPVTLVLADDIYRPTPVGDANIRFQLLLEMSGPTTVYGPVLGQARDPETGVVITISQPTTVGLQLVLVAVVIAFPKQVTMFLDKPESIDLNKVKIEIPAEAERRQSNAVDEELQRALGGKMPP